LVVIDIMTCNWDNKDCCELLSAYLDGEVTASERQQVEEWLTTDPRMQQLHQRLLKLHYSWQNLPNPEPKATADQIASAMFEKMERRGKRRLSLLGGGAIAALLVATVSSFFLSDNSPIPQIAVSPKEPTTSEPLKIALNRPVVPIPEAAMGKESE
jgi:anti-sigma factor RsiW